MNIFKNFLFDICIWLGDLIGDSGYGLKSFGYKYKYPNHSDEIEWEKKVEDLYSGADFALKGLPTSFTSFKEGLASENYCTRHDAAAKVVSWYVHEQGQPTLTDLIKAAEVLLEDTPATDGDVSFLVGAWKDQASATTEEERTKAEETEAKIYQALAEKITNKSKEQ